MVLSPRVRCNPVYNRAEFPLALEVEGPGAELAEGPGVAGCRLLFRSEAWYHR